MNNQDTAIIILAAGSSSRLGKPKQNLKYRGQTLLQRAVETALASACTQVLVVLGANEAVIKPTIAQQNVKIILNEEWEQGMSSSIRAGISALKADAPEIKAVVLMLCDQPFVDTYIINMLMMAKTKAGIAACEYDNAIGPPALFDAVYFDELLTLTGGEGARKLLKKYAAETVVIPFAQGGIDIDTAEDAELLK